jgi:hypothetical protein
VKITHREWAGSGIGERVVGLGLLALLVLIGLSLWQPVDSRGAFPTRLPCGTEVGGASPTTGLNPIAPIIENEGEPVETHTYFCGPIPVYSGQNRIDYQAIMSADRPREDGWITRIKPDMMAVKKGVKTVRGIQDLYTPPSDEVMFHHGVWLNLGPGDLTSGGPQERVYATGEEKTELRLPDGYGYRYDNANTWVLNHMIHNLVPRSYAMYISWEIDFIPDTSPLAEDIERVRTIWMDVQNGCYYPVFDAERGDGGADGKFTYPDDAENLELYCNPNRPYGQTNRWRVPQSGNLVASVGHVHSGGLWTDLNLIRNNAETYQGPTCEAQASRLGRAKANLRTAEKQLSRVKAKGRSGKSSRSAAKSLRSQLLKAGKRKQAALAALTRAETNFRACDVKVPRISTDSVTGAPEVRLFRSDAKYFDRIPGPAKSGPVSWDMGMFNTTEEYRVRLEQGDWLETTTTYETKVGSWYESMGIHISYMAFDEGGVDPFLERVDHLKELNHGPLPENSNHGGKPVKGAPDPRKMPNGLSPSGELLIGGYTFGGGDFFGVPGAAGRPLVVKQGQSLRFRLASGDVNQEMWHSLTSCKTPCNRSTGIAYPLPNGEQVFDSGQLGPRLQTTGAIGRNEWETPANLRVGTHTFYCRIHPLMRGAIRVVPNS